MRIQSVALLLVALAPLSACGSDSDDSSDESSWSGTREVSGRVYLGHNIRRPDVPVDLDGAQAFLDGKTGFDFLPGDGEPCAGWHPLLAGVLDEVDTSDEYDNIVEGATVEVVDGSGDVVATGELGPGTMQRPTDVLTEGRDEPYEGNGCVFDFSVPDVPGDSPSLTARIAGYDREVPVTAETSDTVRLDFN